MYAIVVWISIVAIPQIVDPDKPLFPDDVRAPAETRPTRQWLTDDEIRAIRKEQARERSRAAILRLRQARYDRHQATMKYRQQRAQQRTKARHSRAARPYYLVPMAPLAAMHRYNVRTIYGGR